jgi:hypothetical protein
MDTAKERLDKHVSAETDMHTRTVLSARAKPRSYKEDTLDNQVSSVQESEGNS